MIRQIQKYIHMSSRLASVRDLGFLTFLEGVHLRPTGKALGVSFGLLLVAQVLFTTQVVFASSITERKVVELVNESRLSYGLGVVVEDAVLSRAAQEKAEDMFLRGYFSHDTPDGVEPWYWIKHEGFEYKSAGENLAINFTEAEKQHRAWLESPTHRKNVMNPKFDKIGVAVVSGVWKNEETTIVVQFFAESVPVVMLGVPSEPVQSRQLVLLNQPALEESTRGAYVSLLPFNQYNLRQQSGFVNTYDKYMTIAIMWSHTLMFGILLVNAGAISIVIGKEVANSLQASRGLDPADPRYL